MPVPPPAHGPPQDPLSEIPEEPPQAAQLSTAEVAVLARRMAEPFDYDSLEDAAPFDINQEQADRVLQNRPELFTLSPKAPPASLQRAPLPTDV